jgi:hypothetical protein
MTNLGNGRKKVERKWVSVNFLCVSRKHWNADRILRMEQPHCDAWSHEPFSGYIRLRALALYKETMHNSKTFSGMSAVRSFRAIIPIDEEKERKIELLGIQMDSKP